MIVTREARSIVANDLIVYWDEETEEFDSYIVVKAEAGKLRTMINEYDVINFELRNLESGNITTDSVNPLMRFEVDTDWKPAE
jgi:hypothetical protein